MSHTALLCDLGVGLVSTMAGRADALRAGRDGGCGLRDGDAARAARARAPAVVRRDATGDEPRDRRLARRDVSRERGVHHPRLASLRHLADRARGARRRGGRGCAGGECPAGRPRRRAGREAATGLRACDADADVRPADPHGARRGRVDDRRRRAALSRCVQQRAGRRPFAPAGRRRDCAARAAAQHEHAVSPRCRGRAGRAAARDDSARDRHVPLRQLRERGERARLAHPHRDHGSGRREW